jgi:hypothetical protein
MAEGSGIARRESEVYHKDIPINPDPMKINVLFKNSGNKQTLEQQTRSENTSNIAKASSPQFKSRNNQPWIPNRTMVPFVANQANQIRFRNQAAAQSV